ncbi:permease-like cell division protein FtsX [Sporolituus thermophilus]|uniref:Cell division protein FtsX n=1 Tax=Sporolituus thermophilus DSM 23256 TaxID=1123285 RepID=A0A1G7ML02_9FIRM|nr:permease-like cell division protein FtsX [Sporolituus thermophilus]SDF62558.1 cell division transport system permease protein [Sporolituus thermophilus DSM 23256]
MKIRTLEYFIREAFSSLRHNSLMSVASVSTVALSLLILGLFLVMVLNLNHMASALESQVQISVYLQDNLTAQEMRAIGEQITKLPGVIQVTFVSKDEALARFKQRLGEQQGLLTALGDTNPLPNSYEIKVDKPENVKPVAQAAEKIKGVENARFGQEVVDRLFHLTRMVRIFGVVIIIFLALAALFIIANTIRITVFARRKEIGIMKYVGATDWFIRWPFLIEGMILGFGGALIAVVLLNETYAVLTEQVYESLAFLPLIPKRPFLTNLSIVLLVLGTTIGALGSTISLKRFMKV